jgi:hypothetical protein
MLEGYQMTKLLTERRGKGLSPEQFIATMTKNKEQFQDYYNQFVWRNEDDRDYFASLNHRDDLHCFILAADWCGDVIRNVPVVLQALRDSGIPTEILIQEQHMEVMDEFLTLGGRAIPIVIFTDTGGFVLGHWGPRPKYIQEPMVQFKQDNLDRNAATYETNLQETRKQIIARYGTGTEYHQWIVDELRELISGF